MTSEPSELCQRTQEAFLQGDAYSKTMILNHTLKCSACQSAYEQFNDIDSRLSGAAEAIPGSNEFVLRVLKAIEAGPLPPLQISPPGPNYSIIVPLVLFMASVGISLTLVLVTLFGRFDADKTETLKPMKASPRESVSTHGDTIKASATVPSAEIADEDKIGIRPKLGEVKPKAHGTSSASSPLQAAITQYRNFEGICASRSRPDGNLGGRRIRRLYGVVESLPLESSEQWRLFIKDLESDQSELKNKAQITLRDFALTEARRIYAAARQREKSK